MEQLKAMYPVCTLTKSDGTRCGSPALTGTNFCFHHIGGKIPTSKPETRRLNTPLKLVYPSCHEAIQHNLFLVMQALSEGKIDNATAITYNRLLRSAQLNLQRWQAAKSKLNQGEAEERMPLLPEQHLEVTDQAPESSNQENIEIEPAPCAPRAEPCMDAELPPPEHHPANKCNELDSDQPKEFKPYLTWGEEEDLKLAEMKRLREQDEARLREQSLPAS